MTSRQRGPDGVDHVEVVEGGVGAGEQRVAETHAVAGRVRRHVGEEGGDDGVRRVQSVRRPRVVERDVDAAVRAQRVEVALEQVALVRAALLDVDATS